MWLHLNSISSLPSSIFTGLSSLTNIHPLSVPCFCIHFFFIWTRHKQSDNTSFWYLLWPKQSSFSFFFSSSKTTLVFNDNVSCNNFTSIPSGVIEDLNKLTTLSFHFSLIPSFISIFFPTFTTTDSRSFHLACFLTLLTSQPFQYLCSSIFTFTLNSHSQRQ